MLRASGSCTDLSPRLGWGPIASQQQLGSISRGTITYTLVASSLSSLSTVVKTICPKPHTHTHTHTHTHRTESRLRSNTVPTPALQSAAQEIVSGDFRRARDPEGQEPPGSQHPQPMCPGVPGQPAPARHSVGGTGYAPIEVASFSPNTRIARLRPETSLPSLRPPASAYKLRHPG